MPPLIESTDDVTTKIAIEIHGHYFTRRKNDNKYLDEKVPMAYFP
jgi:hypothetical protein